MDSGLIMLIEPSSTGKTSTTKKKKKKKPLNTIQLTESQCCILQIVTLAAGLIVKEPGDVILQLSQQQSSYEADWKTTDTPYSFPLTLLDGPSRQGRCFIFVEIFSSLTNLFVFQSTCGQHAWTRKA